MKKKNLTVSEVLEVLKETPVDFILQACPDLKQMVEVLGRIVLSKIEDGEYQKVHRSDGRFVTVVSRPEWQALERYLNPAPENRLVDLMVKEAPVVYLVG